MEIACVGAGPASLYFSILMKQADPGHRIVVYEGGRRSDVSGWGMGFWGGSWDDLLRSLFGSDATTAERVRDSAVRWRGQSLVLAGEALTRKGVGHGISHRTLVEILTGRALELGVEIRFDQQVSDITEVGDPDVIVAGDGVGSPTRRGAGDRFGTECVLGRNKYVWLGSDKIFDTFTNVFERTDSGWIWIHGYAIDSHSSACIVECAPETWRGLGLDSRSAREGIAVLESIFRGTLEGSRLLTHGADSAFLPWQSFRTITNRRWWSGKTVLVGDAAHTAHFSIGSGTRLALQDAIELAGSLREEGSLHDAFASYQKARCADVAAAQRDAWFSARWLEDIDRYSAMGAPEFFTLLRARRDPLLARVPPAVYHRLYSTAERNPLLRNLKSRVGPKVRGTYSQFLRRSA
jgi:2-polyprenyl-6-methoxyphenol hydroxylase-like FAD-dependent oxidoreductase